METVEISIRSRLISAVALLFLVFLSYPEAALSVDENSLTLVSEGKTHAVIVLPSSSLRPRNSYLKMAEEDAARILQEHIAQISGAQVPIRRENELGIVEVKGDRIVSGDRNVAGGNFILVGEGDLCKRLGASSQALGPGGLLVKTFGNALVLIGHPAVSHPQSDGGGVRGAVITFLEHLGCRYLWPGETGKIVPARTTITVGPLIKQFTPPVGQRNIRWFVMTDRSKSGLGQLGLGESDWQAGYGKAVATKSAVSWTVWHGLGGDLKIAGGHAFGWVWGRFGKKHPEWFALQADGTRDQSGVNPDRVRLCKSNTGLIEAIADDIIERVKQKPDTLSVSLGPNDGGYSSFCLCEECKKLDPPNAPKVSLLIFEKVGEPKRAGIEYPALTDRMVFFWNRIIERVVRIYPNLLFVVDAYSAYKTPPVERRLHPNCIVRYVPSDMVYLDGWRKAGASKILWRPNILLTGKRSGTISVYGRRLSQELRQMSMTGLVAVDFDSIINNWAVHGLNYYVAARLCWNPGLDYNAILEDYCQSGFGAASGYIRDYFLLAESATGSGDADGLTLPVIKQLRNLLERAETSVAGDEAVKARIRAEYRRTGRNLSIHWQAWGVTAE